MEKNNTESFTWDKLTKSLEAQFGKTPDVTAILFLIGIQESGIIKQTFNKQEKQDLINLGICYILQEEGYYKETGKDSEGWPIFQKKQTLPPMSNKEEDLFIKEHILTYFQKSK